MTSYYTQVQRDAQDLIDEYLAEFIESNGSSFWDWITYDGQLHETAESCFNSYDEEQICDESDNLETDSGLWRGITDWRQMRQSQAFWTLKSDLWFAIEEILKEPINEDNLKPDYDYFIEEFDDYNLYYLLDPELVD